MSHYWCGAVKRAIYHHLLSIAKLKGIDPKMVYRYIGKTA
jgi:hypothetical protein